MKILFIIDNLSTGGAQRQIVNLSIGLKNLNHEVFILTYYKDNYYEEVLRHNNIQHIKLEKRSQFDLSIVTKIAKVQKKEKFDIICSYLFTPSFYSLLLKLLIPKVKVVVSERTFEGLVSKFDKLVTRRLYILSNAIITNSFHQSSVLKSKYPFFTNKIYTITNGVDLNLFKPEENNNKTNQHFIITSIGRVSSLKNTKLLIEAANELINKENFNISINWIGANHERIGEIEYFNECESLIKNYNLSNHWSWLGQSKNPEKYLRDSDILVHPSFGEGFPNVICEALSSGVPVVASNVYDHPLIIEDGINGYLFDPTKLEDLIEKIKWLYLLHDSDMIKMRLNSRRTAEEKFSNTVLAKSYEKLFKDLVK